MDPVTRLLLLLAAAGCGFSPSLTGGVIACGESEPRCPPGFECAADGRCYRPGEGPTNDGGACPDGDGDGHCDADDNCPKVDNPGQGDCDGNDVGDACDPGYSFEAGCVIFRGTLVSTGGTAASDGHDLVGTLGEPGHSISAAGNLRLRGGLLPASPGQGP